MSGFRLAPFAILLGLGATHVVKFIRQSVAGTVWRALGSVDGGEVIGDY